MDKNIPNKIKFFKDGGSLLSDNLNRLEEKIERWVEDEKKKGRIVVIKNSSIATKDSTVIASVTYSTLEFYERKILLEKHVNPYLRYEKIRKRLDNENANLNRQQIFEELLHMVNADGQPYFTEQYLRRNILGERDDEVMDALIGIQDMFDDF